MCDLDTQSDVDAFVSEQIDSGKDLSRRDFGKISMAVTVGMLLPPVSNAQAVTESDVRVETPDGIADCYFVHPASGEHPAVIVWPDILGLRPAFRQMGKRLAQSGFSVLVVNPFYRDAVSPVVGEGASFSQPETRAIVLPMARNLNAETHFSDARAMISYLDQQAAVDRTRLVGTIGYCMGGPMVMRTVAAVPERMGAGGTFHGGGLATEAENSPHRLIPETQASVLHCIAANDDESSPEAKGMLREAYADSNIPAEIEVYRDTLHGWCPPDSLVYNEIQAERAWSRMLNLFENALA